MMKVWRSRGAGLLTLLAAACGPAAAPVEETPEDMAALSPDEALAAEREALRQCGQVTAEGYCGVTFGASEAEADAAFPVPFEKSEAGANADTSAERCHELFPVAPVTGVSFLVEGGRVGRVDVMTETVRTHTGFGVGTQASAIRTHYGDAMGMATNELEPEITDISAMEGTTKFVFEIHDGLVRAWRAGIAPTIDYVAHCG